jgi:hypothetical protein
VLEIGALDYGSAAYLSAIFRPMRPRADGTKERLKEDDVRWVIADILRTYGLPQDWQINFHMENGTATYRRPDAMLAHQLSGGTINFHWTEMQGRYWLLWDEKHIGNFRGKAPLESAWNLHHNYEAFLTGYIGKDWDSCPAELHGQRKEVAALLKLAAHLPAATRAKLQQPMLTFDEFCEIRLWLISRINRRTDHRLEAFDIFPEWREHGSLMPWRPRAEFDALMPFERPEVEWRTPPRLESPRERLAKLRARGHWRPCPDDLLACIVNLMAEDVTVSNHRIQISRGTRHYTYIAGSRAAEQAQQINNGDKLLAAFNPRFPEQLYLLRKDGSYVGVWQRFSRDNPEAHAIREGYLRETMDNVRRLKTASGEVAEQLRRRESNARLLREAGINPATLTATASREIAAALPEIAGTFSADDSRRSTASDMTSDAEATAATRGHSLPETAHREPENITDGAQARPFSPSAAVTRPLPSAPADSAAPVPVPVPGAETVAPALNPTEPRPLTGAAPSLSAEAAEIGDRRSEIGNTVAAQIAAAAVQANEQAATKPRRQAAVRSLYRDALKNL